MYQNPFTERFLVIAEKPSVARTIAQVLVCEDKKDGYLEGPDGVVSWCFGHLAEYAMPEAYDERYRKWSLEYLPIIPDKWKLEVTGDKAKQFRVLKELLHIDPLTLTLPLPARGAWPVCGQGYIPH